MMRSYVLWRSFGRTRMPSSSQLGLQCLSNFGWSVLMSRGNTLTKRGKKTLFCYSNSLWVILTIFSTTLVYRFSIILYWKHWWDHMNCGGVFGRWGCHLLPSWDCNAKSSFDQLHWHQCDLYCKIVKKLSRFSISFWVRLRTFSMVIRTSSSTMVELQS